MSSKKSFRCLAEWASIGKFMCLKIDNKSDWCSRESLAKNISTSCVGFMWCQVLDCNTLPSLRHGIRNYYLLALLSWWWIIEAPRKNISLSFVFFTIGSYRSLLNCLFCSLAWQKGIYILRGLEDTVNWKALANVIEICCGP